MISELYENPLYWIENRNDDQFGYLLLIPAFGILSIVGFWPLLRTLDLSIHADAVRQASYVGEFIGIQNYIDLLTGDAEILLPRPFIDFQTPFKSSLIVTIVISITSVVVGGILGVGQALVLNQSFKGRGFVRLTVLLPWATPVVIHGMMFFLLFAPSVGFLVDPLHKYGIISAAPLSNSSDALIITTIASIWKSIPFIALLTLAGMQSVDRDLYSVAKVAGATKWQRFRLVTFPIILPTILVALLFRTMQTLKIYGIVEVIGGCNTVPTLTCMVISTFRSGYYATSSAIAILTAIVVGIFAMIYLVAFGGRDI